MIKTLEDYRKNILGIRFRGSTQAKESETQNYDLVFLADSTDLELQKPMVDKITSLFKTSPLVLTEAPKDFAEIQTLFVFGDLEHNLSFNESFSFKSFSEIAQSPNLKRDLWDQLKKYT